MGDRTRWWIALCTGLAIGAVLVVSNVYFGLKTGWWDGTGILPSLLGFSLLGPALRGRGGFSVADNVLVQSAATAMSQMPSVVGVLSVLPALALIGHAIPAPQLVVFGIFSGLLGILVAIQLRQRMVVEERLPFPTGLVTAQLIGTLHESSQAARSRLRTLVGCGAFAMAVTWARDSAGWIPQAFAPAATLLGQPTRTLTLGISWSPLLFSAGALVGPKNGLGMLLGSFVAWGLVVPTLLAARIVEGAEFGQLVAWLLWPGVAMLVGGGLPGVVSSVHRAIVRGGGVGRQSPLFALVLIAAAASAAWAFGLSPGMTVLGVLVALVSAVVCCRCNGESGVVPITSLAQLMQIVVAPWISGRPEVSLGAAAVAAGAAPQSTQLLESFKVAELIGAPMRDQVRAQIAGVLLGALVAIPAYWLITSAYPIGDPALPAPTAQTLGAIAGLGSRELPAFALTAALAGLAAGLVLAALQPTRLGRWVPSPTCVGIAFLVPASQSAAMACGAMISGILAMRRPLLHEQHGVLLASGGVVGESLMAMLIAATRAVWPA